MAFSLSTKQLLYLPPQTVAPKQHCLLRANMTLVSPTHRRLYSPMSISQVFIPKRVFQKQMVRGVASSLFSLAVDIGEDPKMEKNKEGFGSVEKNKEEVNNGLKNKEEVNNGFDSVECSTGSSIGVAPPHRSLHIWMGERTKSQISLLVAILFLVFGGWKMLLFDEHLNSPAYVSGVLDSLFEKGEVNHSTLEFFSISTRLSLEKILVYYILHLLEKKPFHPGLVAKLIHLRKESKLEDDKVARVLKMTSKLSIDKAEELDSESEIPSHFGEIYYLSKLPEFCSVDCCVDIKRIFCVSDEDAEKLLANTMIVGGLGLETEVD
ncbi:hypothetical protein BUALT_Bualt12G0096200 [Buddleja alternifolia]|uniref:Armadillo-like repeats domain-containing protein n=1 Tax=Buddleja alternifolia TaxID=168488 RepID=A0AAV6WYF9_9LAMI|nr:hypothetical protein BUALT_Bualt12G0096200 [Buddleja alternifolia]